MSARLAVPSRSPIAAFFVVASALRYALTSFVSVELSLSWSEEPEEVFLFEELEEPDEVFLFEELEELDEVFLFEEAGFFAEEGFFPTLQGAVNKTAGTAQMLHSTGRIP